MGNDVKRRRKIQFVFVLLVLFFTTSATTLIAQSPEYFRSLSRQQLEAMKEEALRKEDYRLADRLKKEIEARSSGLPSRESIMAKIEDAVSREDYELAAKLQEKLKIINRIESIQKSIDQAVEENEYGTAAKLKAEIERLQGVLSGESPKGMEKYPAPVDAKQITPSGTRKVTGVNPPYRGNVEANRSDNSEYATILLKKLPDQLNFSELIAGFTGGFGYAIQWPLGLDVLLDGNYIGTFNQVEDIVITLVPADEYYLTTYFSQKALDNNFAQSEKYFFEPGKTYIVEQIQTGNKFREVFHSFKSAKKSRKNEKTSLIKISEYKEGKPQGESLESIFGQRLKWYEATKSIGFLSTQITPYLKNEFDFGKRIFQINLNNQYSTPILPGTGLVIGGGFNIMYNSNGDSRQLPPNLQVGWILGIQPNLSVGYQIEPLDFLAIQTRWNVGISLDYTNLEAKSSITNFDYFSLSSHFFVNKRKSLGVMAEVQSAFNRELILSLGVTHGIRFYHRKRKEIYKDWVNAL